MKKNTIIIESDKKDIEELIRENIIKPEYLNEIIFVLFEYILDCESGTTLKRMRRRGKKKVKKNLFEGQCVKEEGDSEEDEKKYPTFKKKLNKKKM